MNEEQNKLSNRDYALRTVLMAALSGDDEKVRQSAIFIVGELRLTFMAAELKPILGERSPDGRHTRGLASMALGKLGAEFFIDLAKHEDPRIRAAVADALGVAGQASDLDTTVELFLDDDEEVSLWASLALAKIGESSIEVVSSLLTRDLSYRQRRFLLDALDKIGTSDSLDLAASTRKKYSLGTS